MKYVLRNQAPSMPSAQRVTALSDPITPFATVGTSGTITGTVVDNGSVVWAGATITVSFRPNPSNAGSTLIPMWNGAPLVIPVPIVTSLTGGFSLTLPTNATITPVNSEWVLTICPNASISCISVPLVIDIGTTDISSDILDRMPNPPARVQALALPRIYDNAEVIGNPPLNFGAMVANTTTSALEYWDGSVWQDISSGSPAPPPQVYPPVGIPQSTGTAWGPSIPWTPSFTNAVVCYFPSGLQSTRLATDNATGSNLTVPGILTAGAITTAGLPGLTQTVTLTEGVLTFTNGILTGSTIAS